MNASFIKGIGMKIHRSSKCYFDKWLTQKKIQEIKDILKEYSNACNYFVKNYEDSVCSMTKFDLTNSKYIQKYIEETGSFLTARLIKDAFNEAYGAVKSAKSISKNRKDNKYFSPKFYGKRIVISQCCNTFEASNSTKIFDINLTLKSFRTDKNKGYKISIPLKKHAQFNKWNNIGMTPLATAPGQVRPEVATQLRVDVDMLVDRLLANPGPPLQTGASADDLRRPAFP